jgi:nucleolar protein 58
MLVLFETAAGYALFEVLQEGKLKEPDELWKEFETPEAAKKTYVFFKVFKVMIFVTCSIHYILFILLSVKLVDFQKFENMSEAVASISDLLEGKLSKDLKKFLKESFEKIEISSEKLAVMDTKIGNILNRILR